MQKGHNKKDIFKIAEDFFDDEFFSPSLPFTDISRVQIPKPKIKKFDIDEEFDTKEDNLNKDFDPYFKNDNKNFTSKSFSSHSYFTSSSQEGQGEPKIEKFEKSVFTSNKEGKKVGESRSKYENSGQGIKKEAHVKKIDEKTYKIIKENKQNSNEEVEHRVYRGITGEEVNDFESQFEKYREGLGDHDYPALKSASGSGENKKKKEKKHKQIN